VSLEIRTEHEGPERRLMLAGELDIASVPDLERALEELSGDGAEGILVDLSGLRFMDGTGLRAILRADERLRNQGEQLLLMRGPAAVQSVFQTTGIEPRLDFRDGAHVVEIDNGPAR
jgi:anti-anti-sigma factor